MFHLRARRLAFFFFFLTDHLPEIDFRLETKEAVPAALSLAITSEIVRLAKLKSNFGPDIQIEIIELRRGSFRGKLRIAAEIAAVGAFLLMLEARFKGGRGAVAQLVAEACLDHGVTKCTFEGGDIKFSVDRTSMPA